MTSFPAHLHSDVLSNGLLLLDKPPHWEVPEVVAAVQRATRAAKVASVAPLDAAASGLMLLCFGAATRLSARVEAAPKRYEGSLVLGAAAAAVDVRGGSLVAGAMPWDHVMDEELQEAADGMMAALNSGVSVSVGFNDDGSGDEDGDGAASSRGGGSAGGRAGSAAAAAGGSGGGVTLQVLPPRFRLRQYSSSFRYYEDDDGPSIHTVPVRLLEFKAWRASEEEILRAAAAAAAAAAVGAKSSAAAAARSRLGLADPRVSISGGGSGGDDDVAALVGRVVRFSVLLSGRAHVRSLVAMYGRRLRTCAVLDELRRTQVASFDVGDAWSLEAVLPILQRYKR
ncbi:hypothetical protein PLESTB_000309100 [Pleodorina starrii]|uniref:tRNA pseudouridine(55) synthase n=1 Tax=Pleodorina starrii TaxID=330485 RepID=A0A9W6BDW5_9CHLO|nr:hypothetical protein PLESTB_000309100 [Pleodorina starrii]GLC76249.1 hypothetical protein PLESTF_001755300 [Pleodorina starrii]